MSNLELLLSLIASSTEGFSSAIELGSGPGDKLAACRCETKVGVEIHRPAIEEAERNVPDAVFIHADMREFVEKLKPNAVEVILICDALEHLEKVEALDLIEKSKEVAERIVLFIPIGVHYQEGHGGNPYQRHLSTWSYDEVEALGFDVERIPTFYTEIGKPATAAFCIWNRPIA